MFSSLLLLLFLLRPVTTAIQEVSRTLIDTYMLLGVRLGGCGDHERLDEKIAKEIKQHIQLAVLKKIA